MEHRGFATRDVQQTGAQSHRAARRNLEHEVRLVAALVHVGHLAAGAAEHLDGLACVLAGHVHRGLLDGFQLAAGLVLLDEHARATYL